MEFSQFIAQTKDSRRLQGQRYSYGKFILSKNRFKHFTARVYE